MIQKTIQQVTDLVEQIEILKPTIVKQLTDQTISLDERWNLLSKITNRGILDIDYYGDADFDLLPNGQTLYGLLNIERGTVRTYSDTYKDIQELVMDGEISFSQEELDNWRASVLMRGDQGFRYDW